MLRGVSLTVAPGRFVGIAGPSGCGKSSLIKLIAKLEPCQGRIRLGGDDLAGLSRAQIARRIALVPQEPFLIADTVYNNICYGLERPASPDEVARAARMACLDGVIDKLPGATSSPSRRAGATCPAGSGSGWRWRGCSCGGRKS